MLMRMESGLMLTSQRKGSRGPHDIARKVCVHEAGGCLIRKIGESKRRGVYCVRSVKGVAPDGHGSGGKHEYYCASKQETSKLCF